MASIQEMQKAKELMKGGLDLKTAVAQARTPVTATSQINQDRLAQNQANRQANPATPAPVTPTNPVAPAPITPAPIVNAPVDQTTGLSKPLAPVAQPVQPAPVVPATPAPLQAEVKTPEVKPVVASSTQKTEAPIDYTQAKGREQDIINNLNTFKAQNMTPEQIMKASDYQNATPEKKALIEPYLKQQVPTASAMYNNIVAKADIPDEQKTTLPYKIASNRYAKANMYSTMTPSQLSSEMTNSKLIQGSQAYEDLKAMNPKLVQDTENLRIVNGSKQNVFTYVNNPDGTTTKTNNLEKTFAEDYMDNFKEAIQQMFTVQTPEQIRAIIRTPDAAQAEDKAFELEGKIDEIDKLIEESDKAVEESLAGSGASGQRIQLKKQAQKEKLEKEKRSIEKDYTRYANKANSIITQNTSLYLNSQQQKQAQNTAMLPFITDQYKTAQAKAQAEQALQDPATQIGQTMAEFEKMGITSQGSLASKISEFKQSGLSLPEYVNNLRKLYMAKPEYQRIQNYEAGKGISYQTIGDSVYRQNADGSLTKTNISANKTKDPVWQEWTDSNGVKQAGWITPGVNPTVSTGTKATGNIVPVTAGNKTVRLDQVGAGGFENAMNQLKSAGLSIVVGEGARDQTATIKSMADRYGIPFNASNPAETAQKLRSAGHQVADPGKSNHESGMAIDVYGDSKLGKVTPAQEKILNANGWFSAGIPGDAGHFEYRGGSAGTGGEDIKMQALSLVQGLGGTADERQAFADNVIKVAQRDNISLADAKKKLGYKSADDTEFAKARATEYKSIKSDTRDKLSNANTALTLLNSPQTAIGDVASIVGFLKTIDPASVARESEVESVENARGMIDGLSNIFAKAKEGTKLTDTQRTQLKGAIQTIVDAGNAKYYESIYNTSKEFKDRGLDPTVYISKNDVDKAQKQFGQSDKIKEEITSIFPGATGFKSFMSELTTLLQ